MINSPLIVGKTHYHGYYRVNTVLPRGATAAFLKRVAWIPSVHLNSYPYGDPADCHCGNTVLTRYCYGNATGKEWGLGGMPLLGATPPDANNFFFLLLKRDCHVLPQWQSAGSPKGYELCMDIADAAVSDP